MAKRVKRSEQAPKRKKPDPRAARVASRTPRIRSPLKPSRPLGGLTSRYANSLRNPQSLTPSQPLGVQWGQQDQAATTPNVLGQQLPADPFSDSQDTNASQPTQPAANTQTQQSSPAANVARQESPASPNPEKQSPGAVPGDSRGQQSSMQQPGEQQNAELTNATKELVRLATSISEAISRMNDTLTNHTGLLTTVAQKIENVGGLG